MISTVNVIRVIISLILILNVKFAMPPAKAVKGQEGISV